MASVIPQSLLNKLERVYIANARGSQGRAMTGAAYLGGSIGGAYLGGEKKTRKVKGAAYLGGSIGGGAEKKPSAYAMWVKENYKTIRDELSGQYSGKDLNKATFKRMAEIWRELHTK